MGSALETLCGQAFGAGQLDMLGVYMQRSWVILNTTSLGLMFLYIFATPLLKFIGQTPEISEAAGTFRGAEQDDGDGGDRGGGVGLAHDLQLAPDDQAGDGAGGRRRGVERVVVVHSGGPAVLSLASAIMLCLETWYFMALILFAGYLKNAEIAVDALSICMNILGWTVMVAIGFNAAISVRVSNELGAARPRMAKFSVVVASITSVIIGLLMALVLVIYRRQYPDLFSDSVEVTQAVYVLTPLLGVSIVINSLQPTLSGVAIGAGWQAYVAYVNIVCYYLFGIPLGLGMGYTLEMGVTSGGAPNPCLVSAWMAGLIVRPDYESPQNGGVANPMGGVGLAIPPYS
ncbi:MATE efflux family protein [Actinidia rufa]|uniref:MATE efflux family protein n=1 Tax=Actinidia rufa TaxID=165716 RepID=A0A7J0EP16_9ERIC|nr:MATE efflux family protein [Actinidia rufa]